MSDNQNQTQNQEPSKLTGQFHSMKGSVVEAVGDATGATSWSQSGKEEHSRGEGEYTAAQAKGYMEDSVVGAVSGDKDQQVKGNAQKEKGQVRAELNKPQ
ncbi:hypothetical protein BKA83DRAFT_4336600 [Pisolithus microcarpus]|nr:hypothetical protein BKA83DRAFT_4336600 [Pisolithus microcarpus]